MDNFNQENLNEQDIEFSTVFSDPSNQPKKSPKRDKKARWPMVIVSVLLVVALFGGALAIVKFIPEKQEGNVSQSGAEISVLTLDRNDIETITVKNKSGNFEFYNVLKENVSTWYAKEYEKEVVNTDFTFEIVNYVSNLKAFREVNSKSQEECGFESPVATATVNMKDGSKVTILVGDNSPDNRGTYLKLANSDKIYLIETFESETLNFEELALANSDNFEGVELGSGYGDYFVDDNLEKFDMLTVTGNNFEQPVVIETNKNQTISEYAAFVVTSPSNRIANNVDELFSIFQSGLIVDGAYSFDVSEKSIRKVGLDKPDFTATLKIKDKTFVYKFKLQEDGNYAVISSDSMNIKMVSASYIGFVEYKTADFYSNWVCMQTLDELSGLVFKVGDKEYSFDIKAVDDKATFSISSNGKTIKQEYFKAFYEEFISLKCSEYTVEKLNVAPEIVVTLKYTDNRKNTVLSFKKATETKYQYDVNGVEMGRLSVSSLKKIVKYVEKVSQNKNIK